MRVPPARQTVAVPYTSPAPIGGWNARDPVAAMPETDAIRLDNWFPNAGRVDVRNGYSAWATIPIVGDIETLAVWNGPSSGKLWAFATSTAPHAYDCTTAGTPAANAAFDALGHTGTKSRYSQVMFNNVAGFYLVCCDENAVNLPFTYDGTTFAVSTITGTGLTPTNLCQVNLFKFRLCFVEANSLNLWFLGLDAISGAAIKIKLGGYCKEGGYLVASATWTFDGGDGSDDKLVCITSKGQVAVFAGDDPTSASSWDLVGVYKIPPPIGRRCFRNFGGELCINTIGGLLPMSQVVAGAPRPTPITDKIRKAFRDAARTYAVTFGWDVVHYPRGSMLFVNVPQYLVGAAGTRKAHQYVMNVDTGSWCRFTDQNAQSWAVFNDELYFGAPGFVRKADAATTDAGAGILAQARTAFSELGAPGVKKLVTMVRPTVETDAQTPIFGIGVDVDFQARYVTPPSAMVGDPSSVWDVAAWDVGTWDGGLTATSLWMSTGGIGHKFSLVFNLMLNGASLSWDDTSWLLQPAQRPGP